jgi:hypothetical protein
MKIDSGLTIWVVGAFAGFLICDQFAGQFSKQSLTYTEPVISSSSCVVPLDLFGGYVVTSDSTVEGKARRGKQTAVHTSSAGSQRLACATAV